jgi:peptidyl-prolyl cis-trans isomerase C
MHRYRPLAFAAIAAVMVIGLTVILAGCGKKADRSTRSDTVVAEVNGKKITNGDLLKILKDQDARSGGRVLNYLIIRQLVRQDAEQRGIKVTKAEIQARLDSMGDDVLATAGKTLQQWIADSGQTEAEVEDNISYQLLEAKLVLTPEQRKEFFEKNKETLQRSLPRNNESVIYRRIVVATKPEAEALRAQLTAKDSKADFAKLAEEKSLDPMNRDRGGMVGWAVKGKLDPPDPALEKVLFSLKPGEVSEPLPFAPQVPEEAKVTPPERWQIVKVEKHIAPHPITMEDNAYAIEEMMIQDPQFQPQLQQFLMNLQSKATIQIEDPTYKPLGEMYAQVRKQTQQAAPRMPGAAGGEAPRPQAPQGGQERRPQAPQGGQAQPPAGQAPAQTK